jgi:hypothetical protein
MVHGQSGTALDRYATSTAAVAPDSESDSQVRNALGYSEELAAQLHSEIASLEHRLETGLTPLPPSPAGTAQQTKDTLSRSHLLERVSGVNVALNTAIARLRELRMRVEL